MCSFLPHIYVAALALPMSFPLWQQLMLRSFTGIHVHFWTKLYSNLDDMADHFLLQRPAVWHSNWRPNSGIHFISLCLKHRGFHAIDNCGIKWINKSIAFQYIYIQQWQKERLINSNRSCEGEGTEVVIWFAVFARVGFLAFVINRV